MVDLASAGKNPNNIVGRGKQCQVLEGTCDCLAGSFEIACMVFLQDDG